METSRTVLKRTIVRYLTKQGMTRTDLAKKLDMPVSTLSSKLLGHRRFSLDDIDKLVSEGVIAPIFVEVD